MARVANHGAKVHGYQVIGIQIFSGNRLTCWNYHGVSLSHAGALNGLDDPDRVPGMWIVVLKREHIVSLRNPALTDAREIVGRSANWQATKAAADPQLTQLRM
jgi:hypothetical protein